MFKSQWDDDDHELGHDAGLPALITSPPECWQPSIELVLEGLMFYESGCAGILRLHLVVIAGGAVGAI